MNILALDSSQEVLSVALESGSRVFYMEIDAGQRHSELLMECVETLCNLAEIRPADLNLVACMKGPGSFTGLRIAYSTAKGLSVALGIPLVAIPTLDCLAWHLSTWPGIIIPAMDAKQGRFFTALYRQGKQLSSYMDTAPETLIEEIEKAGLSPDEKIILTGPGAGLLISRLTEPAMQMDTYIIDLQFNRGRARELLEIAKNATITGTEHLDSGPLYLRKSDAELNRKP